MTALKIKTDPKVQSVFDHYPNGVRDKMIRLRQLIYQTAENLDDVNQVEESLKWGEPSFATKHGSPIRIDWKERAPDQYALYFSCSSRLVPTFREVYNGLFEFEGKRAIVFKLDEAIPEEELKRCITAALQYQKVKKLPLLGL